MENKKKKVTYEWNGKDLNMLKSLYLFFTDRDLGRIFGLSERTIHNILGKYGLVRNKISNEEFRRMTKKIPTIVIKPLSRFDEDVVRLDDIINSRLRN